MILSEDCSPADDDTPARKTAREKLLKVTMAHLGQQLIIEAKNRHGREVKWAPNCFEQVLTFYTQYRNDAKSLMTGDDRQNSFARIDRHKISAAFIMAILHVKPLRFTGQDTPKSMLGRYLNQILAFKTAIAIMAIFARHDGNKLPKAIFPPAKGANYLEHAYLALGHASGGDKLALNLPLLAHWMFYIEQFWLAGKQCLPNEV